MTISDKITLLNYIKKNYGEFKHFWSSEKVEFLENEIKIEICNISQGIYPDVARLQKLIDECLEIERDNYLVASGYIDFESDLKACQEELNKLKP